MCCVALSCLSIGCTDDGGSSSPPIDRTDAPFDTPFDALDADASGDGDSGGLSIGAVNVVQNPASVLSARVFADTSEAASCAVEYGADGAYDQRTSTTEPAIAHEITVVNMRPSTSYSLRVRCTTESGSEATSETVNFVTGALPGDIPRVSVTAYDVERMAPGVTLLGSGGGQHDIGVSPYYFAVDEAGEVVWYYRIPGDAELFNDRSIEMLSDGSLLITTPQGFAVITIGGDVVQDFTPRTTGHTVYHHDAIQLPNGRYMTLSQAVAQVAVDWSTDPIAVLGDLIVELDADGHETWSWSAFDHLDTTRFPSRLSRQGGRGGAYDWTHANSLYYVEADDSIVVSLRHQSWVIKIDRATGDVVWTLGEDGDFDLTNLAPSDVDAWFYAQHAAEMHDGGRVLLYDNGNERPGVTPFGWYSRAVMYRLDEADMSAEQIWSFTTEHYTNFLGDVDLLDNGNVLVTAGGQEDPDLPAQIVEVTTDDPSQVVWLLELEGYTIYRATRLASFYVD